MEKYWIDTNENKQFLDEIREELLSFGHQFPSPGGSSYYLGDDGTPWKERTRETWITSRMAHVYSIGTFATEQKAPLKKSIYSLYQLLTIMKAANYRYLEFISSFDDHSNGNKSLTKVTSPVKEKERSYRGINFFAKRDLQVLEVISRGEYMTFGMQGKDIRKHLDGISSSAITRIFKRLRLHGILEKKPGTYKYFPTSYGKEIIAAGLTVRNLVLIPALA